MTTLRQIDGLPAGFMAATARTLQQIVPEPSLIHLPGRRPEPLLVTMLLHGNEDTGLHALQAVLHDLLPKGLPRALSIFVGNVAAAAQGLRHLDGQPDFNRIWPGTEQPDHPDAVLARQVVDAMAARGVFASIDVHNNTGLNPHYGCVNRLSPAYLQLATLFARTVVYFQRPLGVQSAAFARLCPAITVECGKVGNPPGNAHAARFIDAVLHLEHFPTHPVRHQDIDLYHTVATVKVPQDIEFAFAPEGDATVPLRFVPDIDHMNFRDLPAGTPIAHVADIAAPLEVVDEDGRAVFDDYFEVHGSVLRTRKAVTPAMLTLDARVIRQDCLCYLMERLTPPDG